MRLGFDGAGHVKSRIVLNLSGEVCDVAASGSYNVNFGLGSIALTWVPATGDADGDTNCSLFNAQAVSLHMSLVIEHNGTTSIFNRTMTS